MRPIFIYTLGIISMLTACNSSYSNASSSDESNAKEQQMLDNGFVKGTVILQAKEEGCPVIIQLSNGEKIDPIDLDKSFAVANLNVWVKFARLRRMNRCTMAGPVGITEIQKKAK